MRISDWISDVCSSDLLSSALSRLIAVSENYPQLKSDGVVRDLMTQLEGTENRIATERGRYVQAVQEYNLFIRQFPTVITAKIFGYDTMENYGDRKSVVYGKSVSVRLDLGGRRILKKKKKT